MQTAYAVTYCQYTLVAPSYEPHHAPTPLVEVLEHVFPDVDPLQPVIASSAAQVADAVHGDAHGYPHQLQPPDTVLDATVAALNPPLLFHVPD